jgi:hypothetical protein
MSLENENYYGAAPSAEVVMMWISNDPKLRHHTYETEIGRQIFKKKSPKLG